MSGVPTHPTTAGMPVVIQAGSSLVGKVDHAVTGVADGRKVVATAGTRERLVVSSTPSKKVEITAELANTGIIVVGGSTVIAAAATRRGIPLLAGDTYFLETNDIFNIFLDATVSGEGVTFTYWT